MDYSDHKVTIPYEDYVLLKNAYNHVSIKSPLLAFQSIDFGIPKQFFVYADESELVAELVKKIEDLNTYIDELKARKNL